MDSSDGFPIVPLSRRVLNYIGVDYRNTVLNTRQYSTERS